MPRTLWPGLPEVNSPGATWSRFRPVVDQGEGSRRQRCCAHQSRVVVYPTHDGIPGEKG
jgi:hypothetical protein